MANRKYWWVIKSPKDNYFGELCQSKQHAIVMWVNEMLGGGEDGDYCEQYCLDNWRQYQRTGYRAVKIKVEEVKG
jgi:hypothetical protein